MCSKDSPQVSMVYEAWANVLVFSIKMLDFAARNGVKPMINEFPLTVKGIEEAFDALDSGKMRYRGVLKVQR